jgi:hypothetical protein
MADLPLTRTATILAEVDGVDDDYGTPTRSWVSVGEAPCEVQQITSTEQIVDRTTEIGDWVSFWASDVALTALHRVEIDGATYAVTGPPEAVWHPWQGVVDHVEANLRLVER